MTYIELTNRIPYEFPFAAMLRGQAVDYRRVDTPVIVQGRSGMERHYFRVTLSDGRHTVASDSQLYIEE